MKKVRSKLILGAGLLVIGISLLVFLTATRSSLPAWSPADIFKGGDSDHLVGYECTIKDERGNILSKTARQVSVGDGIITADGRHYQVERVKGNTAYAKDNGLDKDFLAYNEFFSKLEVPVSTVAQANKKVGIYHTHTDESYVPSDGSESIPFKGGIYQVGDRLTNRLRNERVNVSHDKTPHDPHDNNAYHRSRRTATSLMGQNTVSLIDVHRDGIPDPSYYSRKVSDTDVAQLRLVVGRQNPRMSANLDFAKRMMSYANKTHPGIVKEIFMAKGNYNQDLMPTALLIEAGTHTNTKEQAENGVALFADAIPTVLGIQAPGPQAPGTQAPGPTQITRPSAQSTPGAWNALAWIIGLTLLGGGAFLLISSGGIDKAKSRLSGFMSREFTGFLGPRRAKKIDLDTAETAEKTGPEGSFDHEASEAARDNMERVRKD